jgi:hypothetical protein
MIELLDSLDMTSKPEMSETMMPSDGRNGGNQGMQGGRGGGGSR